jgi:predicted ATP-grasp superfamily ATP-dependent carboligase
MAAAANADCLDSSRLTPCSPLRVLITDGNSRSALAATRSLGRLKHVVVVAAEGHPSIAGTSRHAAKQFEYPHPAENPEGFVRAIAAAVASMSIDVVLPMTELSTLLLTRHRAELPQSCNLPFAAYGAIEAASDKARMLQLALETGVPVPATAIATSRAEAIGAIPSLVFPVVVKPARSRVPTRDGWISTGVGYAHDAADLLARLDNFPSEIYPILLQERIAGPGIGIFLCYDRGRQVAAFAHRRLREKPSSGGVSVLCESVAIPSKAHDYSSRLLKRLDWHGVAMVEFKQDNRDGSLRLMEINGRFWGSLQLAIDAGVNFPAILLDVARGNAVTRSDHYRVGIRSRWLLGDLDALLAVLRQPRRQLHLPATHPSRLRLLWDFLHLCSRSTRYEVLKIRDPMPGLIELRRWLFGS